MILEAALFFAWAALSAGLRRDAASMLAQDLAFRELTQGIIEGKYGSYELGRKLGSGAYGVVYEATLVGHPTTKVVAKTIEISSPEAQTSFSTEHRVWQYMMKCEGYPHPNIIQYMEVLQLSARQGVVVMELASGGSLSDLLYKGVSAEGALRGERTAVGDAMIMDEAQAKKLFAQLASGVQWLARCGVIHKDLKPDNIMLSHPYSAGGIVKIVDFGLAAVIPWGENGPDANMYYNMFSQVDTRTRKQDALTFDDFALGMILAELGTGVPPFFNPRFDYFSEKPGNLQDERGILYILQSKKACAKGDTGLFPPKKELAQGKLSIKTAVKEVVGRSLYYLKNQNHFVYRSALENGIGNTPLLAQSWLLNSEAAMDLLSSLIQWSAADRMDPRNLLSSAWLASADLPALEAPRAPAPAPKRDVHVAPPPQAPVATTERYFAPEPATTTRPAPPQPEVGPMCQTPYKERTAPSLCKLRHRSSSNCFVKVSCGGQAPKMVEIPYSFGGGGEIPGCYNCRLQ